MVTIGFVSGWGFVFVSIMEHGNGHLGKRKLQVHFIFANRAIAIKFGMSDVTEILLQIVYYY